MSSNIKGNKVELSTFLSWGKEDIIGYKTEECVGKTFVNFVWCKLCSRHEAGVLSRLKGKVKLSGKAFIDGTHSVTKFQVTFFQANQGLYH